MAIGDWRRGGRDDGKSTTEQPIDWRESRSAERGYERTWRAGAYSRGRGARRRAGHGPRARRKSRGRKRAKRPNQKNNNELRKRRTRHHKERRHDKLAAAIDANKFARKIITPVYATDEIKAARRDCRGRGCGWGGVSRSNFTRTTTTTATTTVAIGRLRDRERRLGRDENRNG